jgi:hypothetical protein
MLGGARTVPTLDQFHALWLGYSVLPHPAALTTRMRTESAKLIERTFQNDASWLELFRATDTYLDTALAQHYGLPAPAGGVGWVPYGKSGRQGLLSHASFLSIMQDTVDTSPTRRGKRVRAQLICQDVPPPPPDVKADAPPQGGQSSCKWDRYEMHRQKGGTCQACHSLMDPIGFGLENYDREGRYRTRDIDTKDGSPTFGKELPQCDIKGKGELVGAGTFSGPAELSNVLIASDLLGPCAATQFHRFAIGRPEAAEDQAALDEFKTRFKGSGYKLRELILSYVSSNAFGYRRVEN